MKSGLGCHDAKLITDVDIRGSRRSRIHLNDGVRRSEVEPPGRHCLPDRLNSLRVVKVNEINRETHEVRVHALGRTKEEALSGAERTQIPAAGVRGQDQTLWLLDAAAASQLR